MSKASRLSDRILDALELSIIQEDVAIAEKLRAALELSMTRETGGGDFVERRSYPEAIETAIKRLDEIKARQRNAS